MRTFFATLISIATASLCYGADGVYQKTRDGRTTVWNSDPKSGDEASWTGDRDADGYAKGFGTLTWYTIPESASGTEKKAVLFARYFGRMDHGKLAGPVNVHAKGKTRHSIFTDGERVTRWTPGPAPYRASAQAAALAAKTKREPEAPAEGPDKPQKSAPPVEARSTSTEKVKREVTSAEPRPKSPKTSEPKPADPSLQLLTGPPSALRHELPPPPPALNVASLTNDEVAEAGDVAVRTHGYDPNQLSRGEATFDAQSGTWTVPYVSNNNADPDVKGFTVTVDDATKGTVFVPAK